MKTTTVRELINMLLELDLDATIGTTDNDVEIEQTNIYGAVEIQPLEEFLDRGSVIGTNVTYYTENDEAVDYVIL